MADIADNQGSREYDRQVKSAERGAKPAGEDAVANELDADDARDGAEGSGRELDQEKGRRGGTMPDRGSSDTTSADKHKRGTAGE